jgi:uncharacterized protein YkwD
VEKAQIVCFGLGKRMRPRVERVLLRRRVLSHVSVGMRYTRDVRAKLLPVFTSIAIALGCGDGVGRPIVEREASGSAAGAAGAAGAPGGAGSSAGLGGAGNGGYGALPALGGRDWRGPEGDGRGPRPPEVHCEGIDEWPEESARLEQVVFGYLNYARDYALPCGTGAGVKVPPVAMKRELQCAARLHSRDMFDNGFFGHQGSDGSTIDERIQRAGYPAYSISDETIADERSRPGEEPMVPYAAVQALIETGGSECAPLVDGRFDSVGIGFFGGLWTLDFAGP